jgi:hypothetical protein
MGSVSPTAAATSSPAAAAGAAAAAADVFVPNSQMFEAVDAVLSARTAMPADLSRVITAYAVTVRGWSCAGVDAITPHTIRLEYGGRMAVCVERPLRNNGMGWCPWTLSTVPVRAMPILTPAAGGGGDVKGTGAPVAESPLRRWTIRVDRSPRSMSLGVARAAVDLSGCRSMNPGTDAHSWALSIGIADALFHNGQYHPMQEMPYLWGGKVAVPRPSDAPAPGMAAVSSGAADSVAAVADGKATTAADVTATSAAAADASPNDWAASPPPANWSEDVLYTFTADLYAQELWVFPHFPSSRTKHPTLTPCYPLGTATTVPDLEKGWLVAKDLRGLGDMFVFASYFAPDTALTLLCDDE